LALTVSSAACGGAEEGAPAGAASGLLEPPPRGQGVQLTTGDFPVDPGTEVQDCYFFRVRDLAEQAGLPPDEPMILHRTQIAYQPGSHHMNIFRVRTILDLDPANGAIQRSLNGQAACSNTVNWFDWPLVANSQNDGYFDWTYPEGVGNELMPDEWLMLQTHYVNTSTQRTDDGGHVDVNLWTMPREEMTHQLGTLFATLQSIRICRSNPTPRFSSACGFSNEAPVQIIGANGHFHARGKRFEMYTWDGLTPETPPAADRFYWSDAWDEPPMARWPDLDATLPPHGGVWYSCSYEWREPPPDVGCAGLDALDKELFDTPDDKLDCCYTFGNTVSSAEHCNVFAYYYPKQSDVICY
jgi:hypothetical protein